MPRRRKANVLPLLIIAAVLFGLWLAFQLILSPFGTLLGAAIIVGAVLYGAATAYQQAEARRIWALVRDVSTLSGAAFEQHVAETYRRLGYQVRLTKKGADAGVDVITDNGIDRVAIQCKQLSSTVGNDAVQQAHTGKTIYACNRAAVVCTTSFTAPAKAAARATGVELIDGTAYAKLMHDAEGRPSLSSPLLPGGRALIREIGWLAVGALILGIHFLGPNFTRGSGQYQAPGEPVTQATTFYPPANTPASPIPVVSQPAIHRALRPKATLPPKHPPWWTPPPTTQPLPTPGASSTAVRVEPMSAVTASPISPRTPEVVGSAAPAGSPPTDVPSTTTPQ